MKKFIITMFIAFSFTNIALVESALAKDSSTSQAKSSQTVVKKSKASKSTSNAKQKTNKKLPAGKKINLNKANIEELCLLPGIGEKKAKLILEYRKKHGAFKNVDELLNIKGIGEKTIKQLKHNLVLR